MSKNCNLNEKFRFVVEFKIVRVNIVLIYIIQFKIKPKPKYYLLHFHITLSIYPNNKNNYILAKNALCLIFICYFSKLSSKKLILIKIYTNLLMQTVSKLINTYIKKLGMTHK
jgi:hypothetical protein